MKPLLCLILICLISPCAMAETTTVYLVRHAEKDLNTKQDPALTEQGEKRAAYWSRVLQHQPISAIYSTDTRRTRSTAEPTAKKHGLEITLYEPGSLNRQTLLENHPGKHVLIVGHSNTVPLLASRLLGQPLYSELPETEYSNLYIVTLDKQGASSVRLEVDLAKHQ